MTTATTSYDNALPPFRLTIVVALFESKNLSLFVGPLLPRTNDLRAYTSSLIEGGIDVGESVADAARRELLEEVGIRDAHFLTAVKTPLLYPFKDAQNAPAKYAGKQALILCFMIPSADQINLKSSADPEGATFAPVPLSDCWFSFREAASALQQGSHTQTHQNYIKELIVALSPIADALAKEKANSSDLLTKPSGFLAQKLDPNTYTGIIPEPFPTLAPTIVRAKLRSLADAC